MKIKPILLTLIAAAALTTSGCVSGPYDYAYNTSGYSNGGYIHSNCNYYQEPSRLQPTHTPGEYYVIPPHLYYDREYAGWRSR